MYHLHFNDTVSERPFQRTATQIRLTTGEPEGGVAQLRGFATITADSGSASMHFYLAQAELRALAAAMVEAAERLEELAQDAKVAA